MARVQRDLAFTSAALEADFRRHYLALGQPMEAKYSLLTLAVWIIYIAKFVSDGEAARAAQCGAAALVTLALLCLPRGAPIRLSYMVSFATKVVGCAVGTQAYHALYAASLGGEASATGALVFTLIGNGVTWLFLQSFFSPLPFRWLFPQMCTVSCLLLLNTATICSNARLQAGYGMAHAAVRRLALLLVPIAAPAFAPTSVYGSPRTAVGAWACGAYQPVCVLLSFAAIAHQRYSSELRQRRAFVARTHEQEQREPAAAGRGADLRPRPSTAAGTARAARAAAPAVLVVGEAGSLDLLLSFVLPAVCALYGFVVAR